MAIDLERDEALREFATDRQWEILEVYWELGHKDAVAKLGIHHSNLSKVAKSVKAKANRRGYDIESHTVNIPAGYKLRGVSTLRKVEREDGTVLEWTKTAEDRDAFFKIIEQMGASLSETMQRLEPLEAAPYERDENRLACYPVGDHHNGMYAWHKDAGGDYDQGIAKKLLTGAMRELSAAVPPTTHALVALMGDFAHYDSPYPVTPTSQYQLDSDSRFAMMIDTLFLLARGTIDLALRRHQFVHVIVAPGNHDEYTMVILARVIKIMYENEPRVTVDTSPRRYHYYEWGHNLIMVHHGDKAKLDQLPLIMAADMPEAWGRVKYRTAWTGHFHRDHSKDVGGVLCETFKVLPPGDHWSHSQGYRARRGMCAIVLKREGGEKSRFTVDPDDALKHAD